MAQRGSEEQHMSFDSDPSSRRREGGSLRGGRAGQESESWVVVNAQPWDCWAQPWKSTSELSTAGDPDDQPWPLSVSFILVSYDQMKDRQEFLPCPGQHLGDGGERAEKGPVLGG